MLESAGVILDVIIVVVRIGEEVFVCSEDERRREVWGGETEPGGLQNLVDLSRVVVKIFTDFVAEVGVCVSVADDLNWVFDPDSTVIGGQDDSVTEQGELSENFHDSRMTEPRFRDRAISRIGVGEFTNHFGLGSGMREHINEVEDHDLEGDILVGFKRGREFLSHRGVI